MWFYVFGYTVRVGNAGGYRVKATGGIRSLRQERVSGDGWLCDGAERRDIVVVRRSLERAVLRISGVRCRVWTTGIGWESIIVVGGVAVVGEGEKGGVVPPGND